MKVTLLEYPTEKDWMEVKRRALVTIGKNPINPPDMQWKKDILNARHSPIRYLRFCFLLEDIPTYVSTHLARHVHSQPYIKSQRNDRQSNYDRDEAPQSAPVSMIYDMNGEQMLIFANKRLCNQADPKTKELAKMMCDAVKEVCPEYSSFLVPMCEYNGFICHEMFSCKRYPKG